MASVGFVNLETGEDRVVFETYVAEDGHGFGYLYPAISSRYIVSTRQEYMRVDGETVFAEALVARSLDDLDGPEIVIDASVDQDSVGGLDAYGEWVVWGRRRTSTREIQNVLDNIETGEQRILDSSSEYSIGIPHIWGDRVVWSNSGEVIKEYRISTGETRIAYTAPPEHRPLQNVTMWDHYALSNPEISSRGTSDVLLIDLDTGEARWISSPSDHQRYARMHDGRVAWTDYRGAVEPSGMHIAVYSLATGRDYILNASATGGANPLIFGRTVVWHGAQDFESAGVYVTRIGDI
jgi:hypothetical protein